MRSNLSHKIRARALEAFLLLVVCGSITFSIAYNNYEAFSRELASSAAPGDTADYIRAYLEPLGLFHPREGVVFHDYRFAAPLLAHLVPDPLTSAFKPGRPFDDVGLAVYKFAVITAVFNLATCVLVYAICRTFELSRLLSLLGAALYSTLTFVLLVTGIPHVDSVFFFVFGLGAYAVLKRNLGLILGATLIGTFAKEAIFLLGFLALLMPAGWRLRARLIGGMVPAALAYIAVRYILAPSTQDYFSSGLFVPLARQALHNLGTLNGLEWVFMGFNFLWFPIAWAVLRQAADPTLLRWSAFIPVLVVVTVLGGSDHFGRSLPLAFPVAIPLALLGIQAVLEQIEARDFRLAVSETARGTERPAADSPGWLLEGEATAAVGEK